MISGGCRCGKTRYEVDQEPGHSFLCQCLDCQKTTGSGHGALTQIKLANLKLDGPVRKHSWELENGNTASHRFCGECGNPILNETSGYPEIAFLHAGSLDDASLFEPKSVEFQKSGQPWDCTTIRED